jgi:hypothetical protein
VPAGQLPFVPCNSLDRDERCACSGAGAVATPTCRGPGLPRRTKRGTSAGNLAKVADSYRSSEGRRPEPRPRPVALDRGGAVTPPPRCASRPGSPGRRRRGSRESPARPALTAPPSSSGIVLEQHRDPAGELRDEAPVVVDVLEAPRHDHLLETQLAQAGVPQERVHSLWVGRREDARVRRIRRRGASEALSWRDRPVTPAAVLLESLWARAIKNRAGARYCQRHASVTP